MATYRTRAGTSDCPSSPMYSQWVAYRAFGQMDNEVREFLSTYSPLTTMKAVWGSSPLEITYYLADEMPPLRYITSVRAIVFKDDFVLVLNDKDGMQHVVPGGRRESNEALEETLRREILEETCWTIGEPLYMGFSHFRHLVPAPTGISPYPDFFQLYFVAEALEYFPEAQKPDDYVLASNLMPVRDVWDLELAENQNLLLEAAWILRQD